MDFWFTKQNSFTPNGDVTEDVFDQNSAKEIDGSGVIKFDMEEIVSTLANSNSTSSNNQTN